MLAEAPVQAGGGYVLEFLYHNSGWLYITPAPDAAPITGSFNKEPDKPDQLRFFYEDADYTYAVSYYSEEGKSLTLLTVDLTAKYSRRSTPRPASRRSKGWNTRRIPF
ncbi:MAG: hypothetical protein ACLUQ6_11195 [Alistipes onderdonkii]